MMYSLGFCSHFHASHVLLLMDKLQTVYFCQMVILGLSTGLFTIFELNEMAISIG